MSPGLRRTVDSFAWLVVAAVVIIYLVAKYDITIRERGPGSEHAAAATTAPIDLYPQEPYLTAAGRERPAVRADAEAEYRGLAVAAQNASGTEMLAVDRRLEAAERAFPSDYRFTYARATLAVYGRAEHHEAFYHLRRAAEKAIATERAREMLDGLEEDGAPKGGLRRLAVGHAEWTQLHGALEYRDRNRLWQEHGSGHSVPRPYRKSASHSKDEASASASIQPTERALPARMRASLLLEVGEPCEALVVLQQVRTDPEVEEISHHARDLCLRGPRH